MDITCVLEWVIIMVRTVLETCTPTPVGTWELLPIVFHPVLWDVVGVPTVTDAFVR